MIAGVAAKDIMKWSFGAIHLGTAVIDTYILFDSKDNVSGWGWKGKLLLESATLWGSALTTAPGSVVVDKVMQGANAYFGTKYTWLNTPCYAENPTHLRHMISLTAAILKAFLAAKAWTEIYLNYSMELNRDDMHHHRNRHVAFFHGLNAVISRPALHLANQFFKI